MIISRNGISLRRQRSVVPSWKHLGTLSISAVTTAPTKATTTVKDEAWYRRLGDTLEYKGTYIHTSNSGVVAGSGVYLFPLPFGWVADTDKILASTTTLGSIAGWAVGKSHASTEYPGSGNVWLYDSQNLAMALPVPGDASNGLNAVGSTWVPITGAEVFYNFHAWVPIKGLGARKI